MSVPARAANEIKDASANRPRVSPDRESGRALHADAEAPRGSAPAGPPKRAPIPPGVFFFGSVFEGWRDPLGLFLRGRAQYGDAVQYRFGWYRYFLFNDPAAIKHVLTDNARNYTKSRNYQGLKVIFGNGLLTSEGEFWKRQRRLSQPAFHRDRLVGFANTMASETNRMLARWQHLPRSSDGHAPVLDVHAEMMRLTFAIVGQTRFTTDVDGDSSAIGEALQYSLEWANDYAESIVRVPPWVPTPRNAGFKKAVRTIDDLFTRIIDERRRSGSDGDDLLGMLMSARGDDGKERMTERQLRDEVLTLVLAGHETTANLLAFTFHLLSCHPEWERRVVAEVRQVIGEREIRFEDVRRLEITRMVLEEALRLYPPAWTFERQAVEDDVVAGYAVPKGSIVGISPYSLHRHPGLWENPEGFDPERFTPERKEARNKYAYLPFGGGPRTCIGNAFAMMEAQIILAKVLRDHTLARVPARPLELSPLITLLPKHGIWVEVGGR